MKTLFEEKEILSPHPDFVLEEAAGAFFFGHASGRRVETDLLGKIVWRRLPGTAADIAAGVQGDWNVSSALVVRFLYLLLRAGIILSSAGRTAGDAPPLRREPGDRELVSAIVITRNGADHIAGCLRSLAGQTLAPIEVLVVDNGSTDGTVHIIRSEFPSVRVLSLKKNIFFPGAVNHGIRHAAGRYLLILNDDTELDSECVQRLCHGLESDPGAGAAAPMMKFFHLRGFINGIGNHIRDHGWGSDNFIGCVDVGQFRGLAEVPSACFGAVMLRRETVREVGGLDERYVAYYEDVDWSFRCRLGGWRVITAVDAVVYHKFGAFWKTQARKQAHVVRNRLRLVLKIFEGELRSSFLKSYIKEDIKGLLSCLKSREFGLAAAYPRAYASLLMGLPGILEARKKIMDKKSGAGAEAVLRLNPEFFSCLSDSQAPRLDAGVFFDYYRWEMDKLDL